MKRIFLVLGLVAASLSVAQYPRDGVRFHSRIALADFPGSPSSGAGISGYTSPSGREYAVMGVRNGTAIIEVTNPTAPVIRSHIPGPSSLWHENAVLGDYCYSVTEGDGGIQVIDLRNIDLGVATLVATYTGNGLDNVHTIQADAATNRLYVNGSNRGFLVLDASNPTSLVEVGRWTTKYVHDMVVRNFTSGPNAGKQIAYLCCGVSGLYILDITNPGSMVPKGILNYYPQAEVNFYCHSASLSPDAKYLMINDEFDENRSLTNSCTTIVVDVENLDAPAVVNRFESGVNTIDHNSLLVDGYLFLAAYKGGVRIYDARSLPALSEVGYFDSYPSGTNTNSYEGNWGVYAGFASGNIVISDINSGLFVLDPSEAIGQGAPLTGFNVALGVPNGELSDLRFSDNKRLVVTQSLLHDVFVFAQTTRAAKDLVDLAIEAKGTGRMNVLLKNHSTGLYVQVGSLTLTTTEQVFNFNNLAAANYVNSSGQIEIRLRSRAEPTLSNPPLELDMVRATFHN